MNEYDEGIKIEENSLQAKSEGMDFEASFRVSPEDSLKRNDEVSTPVAIPLDLTALWRLGIVNGEEPYVVKCTTKDGKQIKLWQCKLCSKEFNHQYTFMRHFPIHTGERKFHCPTCGKSFRQLSTLSQHRAIHSEERPYSCEVCPKTFNRVSSLISHRKTHTSVKPYQCPMCEKGFHQKGNLRNHVYTHTKERPYKCDECGKGFNQISNLACHKLKSHEEVEKPKHFCKTCGMGFTNRILARYHEQNVHLHSVPDFHKNLEPKNGAIFVEPIKTKAMLLANASNQTSFALLRPINGIPVLVKVLPAGGDKQMLVPPSEDDLKKFGKIFVTPSAAASSTKTDCNGNEVESVGGSTVRIKIPVVATVIERSQEGGATSLSIESPGPADQTIKQEFLQTKWTDLFPEASLNI